VLRPAPPDSGIVFRRIDLPTPVEIEVDPFAITDTRLNTTLSAHGDPGAPKVRTIEHLLSACAGLGLDNLRSRHHGRRGADPRRLGGQLRLPAAERRHRAADSAEALLRVLKRVEIREGEGAARDVGAPRSARRLHPGLRDRVRSPGGQPDRQRYEFDMGSGQYKREIARARTFGSRRTSR
jgi:UDP-3-O-[3-hydroxymyristoyl] N-acetylglucosamine deacetylase